MIRLDIVSLAKSGAEAKYLKGDIEFELLSQLRQLPNRRTVWQARTGDKDVLLKIYHQHAKQARDADAEWENSTRLATAGLPVPDPLFRAKSNEGELVVGFEFIENSETLDLHLGNFSNPEKTLRQLFGLHAKQHNSGCFQSDNHLGNYLVSDEGLYMLDSGTFVFHDESLTHQERLENLAMLVANIPLPLIKHTRSALDHYFELCTEEVDRAVFQNDLKSAVSVAIQTRLRKYHKKTLRSCSEFERVDNGGKMWLACRDLSSALKRQLLDDPDQFFTGSKLLKDGNTCTVVEVVSGGKEYVLKRYNRKPLSYRLSHLLIAPRALRSWTNGHVLNLFGIRTPRPYACLIFKSGLFVDRAYLLMEKVSGAPLDEIDLQRVIEPSSTIPAAFARRCVELDTIGATHGDMKATNFIVDDDGHLTLIDLDGLKFDRSPREHERRRLKDMGRFMRNWKDQPELAGAFKKALSAQA